MNESSTILQWCELVSGKDSAGRISTHIGDRAILEGWSRLAAVRKYVEACAPNLYAMLGRTHLRWAKGRFNPHLGLWCRGKWLQNVEDAWGLDDAPGPGACRRAFLQPDARWPMMKRPREIEPAAWASFKLFCWGYTAYEQAGDMGRLRDTTQIQAWHIACIKALMERPDFACWAMNIHPDVLPEPLSEGWYDRYQDWIYGQVAVRQPYLAADPRVRNHGYKVMSWPTPGALIGVKAWTRKRVRGPRVTLAVRAYEASPDLWGDVKAHKAKAEAQRERMKSRIRRLRAKAKALGVPLKRVLRWHRDYSKAKARRHYRQMRSKSSRSTSSKASSTVRFRVTRRKRRKG